MFKFLGILLVMVGLSTSVSAERWSVGLRAGASSVEDQTQTGYGVFLRFAPAAVVDFELGLDKFAEAEDNMPGSTRTLSAGIRIMPPLPGILDWYLIGSLGRSDYSDGYGGGTAYNIADLGIGAQKSFGLLVVGAEARMRSSQANDDQSLLDVGSYQRQGYMGIIHAAVKF